MQKKRIRPPLNVTVDADVLAWIIDEAKRERISRADVVNRVIAREMERYLKEKKQH